MYSRRTKLRILYFQRKASWSKVRAEMVLLVKCLLCIEEILNFIPGIHVKNPSKAMWVFNSIMQTGRSRNFTDWTNQTRLLNPLQWETLSLSYMLKETKRGGIWRRAMIIVLLHPYSCVPIHEQTYLLNSQTLIENNLIRLIYLFFLFLNDCTTD